MNEDKVLENKESLFIIMIHSTDYVGVMANGVVLGIELPRAMCTTVRILCNTVNINHLRRNGERRCWVQVEVRIGGTDEGGEGRAVDGVKVVEVEDTFWLVWR